MRLIILNQFFYPDHSATSQFMTDLAESLVEQNVEVTALAGRGRYNGGEKLPPREVHKGVKIERAWATSYGKGSSFKRLSDYLSFYVGASWKLLRLPRHDIVMALTTPPLIGIVALVIGRLRRMRVVALVQDIYPEVAVSLGALRRRSPVTRLLERLNHLMLRKSDRIIVVGDCMRARIIAKIGDDASSRIDVIHNWADGSEIRPLDAGEENFFAAQHDLKEKFVLLFSGNLGRINEFSTVLDVALTLRERTDILFLFIGEGALRPEIEKFATKHDLANIRLLPYQPRAVLRQSLAACDASLVTLADGLAGLSVPSKSYAILAAGRPILFVGDAESSIARIVKENSCGEVVASHDHHRLARIITGWASERAQLLALNSAARKAFEKYFDRPQAVSAYMKTFAQVLETAPLEQKSGVSKLKETST